MRRYLVSNSEIAMALDKDSQDPTEGAIAVVAGPSANPDGNIEISPIHGDIASLIQVGLSDQHRDDDSDIQSYNLSSSCDDESDTEDQRNSQKRRRVLNTRSKVWEKFTTTYKNGKAKSNKCKNCGKEVSAKPVRMTKHLTKCKRTISLTEDVSATVQNFSPASLSSSVEIPVSTTKWDFIPEAEIKKRMKVWKKGQLQKEHKNMDHLLGKIIFSANLPFRFVENNHLKELVDKASIPGYKMPNRIKIGGEILDEIFAECTTKWVEKLKGKKVVILQDGWSTNRNQPVICHSLYCANESMLLDAVQTTNNKKDANYCFQLLEVAINEAEATYACKVVGIVTDNCSVMKSLRSLVKTKLPGVHAYGCHAHVWNLIGVLFTDDELMDDVIKIQKFFRNHHFESASLDQMKGNRPVIPGKTRWNSQMDTSKSYKENHLNYLSIARDKESNISKETSLVAILNDGNKYAGVEKMITNLTPISTALDKVQSDSCTLADAIDVALIVLDNLPDASVTASKDKLGMIFSSTGIMSHMLHPEYRGRNLTREMEKVGFEELKRLHFSLPGMASSLKALDENVFHFHLLAQDTIKLKSPGSWWRSAGAYSSLPKEAVDICETLMILPSSTASLERIFSTMGTILSKLRNRLGIEKAKKLALVYKTLATEINYLEEMEVDLTQD